MTYTQWRKTYEARKLSFLQSNERDFRRLLTTARSGLYVPEEITNSYRSHVDGVMDEFTNSYHPLLERNLGTAAKFELAGAALLGLGFSNKQYPVEEIATKVATESMSGLLPSGFSLSERVWDLNYSKDILSTVENGLRANLSPEMIAKQLDGFVLPGREVTTITPYGRSLNYDSMRLARSEVMASFRKASDESMKQTPWITGQVFTLSDSHEDSGCECEGYDGQVFANGEDKPDLGSLHAHCGCYYIDEVMSSDEWDAAMNDYLTDGTDEIGIADWLAE